MVSFELDNSLQLAEGRFIFFQHDDPSRNTALSDGFGSLLRGVFDRLAIRAATDSRVPILANILSLEHRLLNRKTPI